MKFLRKYDDLIILIIVVAIIHLSFPENMFYRVLLTILYFIVTLLVNLTTDMKKLVKMKELKFGLSKERD